MKFIDANHIYVNDDGECYTSVTTLIKKYEPYKDWNEIASKYAKKNKKTLEEVKEAWAEASRKALEKGSAFHNKMEAFYIEKGKVKIEDEDCTVCPSPIIDGIKNARSLSLEQGIYPELLIFSHKYKLAGQADLVEVVNNRINIKDYKTSKEIKKESHKDWKKGYEMMSYPLNNLMNSNFWHYSVQLNLYMYMLKAHNPNLKIGTMTILHIVNNENFVHGKDMEIASHTEWEDVIEYQVPNLQKDIKRLLEHYSQK